MTTFVHRPSLKGFLVFFFDLLAMALAWGGALLLRLNLGWQDVYWGTLWSGLAFMLPIHALVCWRVGLYRGLWIFASLPDLRRVLFAVLGGEIALAAFALMMQPVPAVPRSLVILYPLLLIAFMAGGRVAYRMWKEHALFGALACQGKPVVIVGAGRAAMRLLRELERSVDWRVVALLDDDEGKWGRELSGVRVVGRVEALVEIARAHKARHVILAMPSAPVAVRRNVADLCAQASLQLMTIPALEDLMAGKISVGALRRIEIEDLLGRDPVWIDSANVAQMLAGKTVLVTGAGGSIGSELCRQIARFAPAKLVLFEQCEYALYTIEQWFSCHLPGLEVVSLCGDVKDRQRLDEVFAASAPQVVFHAAAYKHVPLMELGNAWQAVRNNVFGTLNVARCAQAHGVERFVLISTDKAVNPTNVMGATKRLAEMACLAVAEGERGTRFEIVRFGNVLGSAGSVIPKFQRQIEQGGPVTVTHPDITRYFMSIPEAAQLVLQAGSMGSGSEIFVLEMGAPIRIVDLARNMIRLAGFAESDIRIEFTGLRPGEKLYEELLADAEQTLPTPHAKLRVAQSRPVAAGLLADLDAWLAQLPYPSDAAVREALQGWVPEYLPALHGIED